MTDSFFVSSDLEGKITKKSLTDNNDFKSFVTIDSTKYEAVGYNNNHGQISLDILIKSKFVLKNKVFIENITIFGHASTNQVGKVKYIKYDQDHKIDICRIIIEEKHFWS